MTDKQLAVVTGASRGIGLAIAKGLVEAGYKVVGTATSEAGLETIRRELPADSAYAFVLNVTDEHSIQEFMDTLKASELQPGVLVNNAGITRDNLLMRMKDNEWDDVISANLSSIYRMSKQFIRSMVKARWGRIVNITSVVGSSGNAGQANYAAAKAGTTGFTKSLAREVANRGITVNAVAPGFIDTDMTQALTEEQRSMMLTQIPAGRLGAGSDVASAVRFLVSNEASYITGETIHVNGGMFMG